MFHSLALVDTRTHAAQPRATAKVPHFSTENILTFIIIKYHKMIA